MVGFACLPTQVRKVSSFLCPHIGYSYLHLSHVLLPPSLPSPSLSFLLLSPSILSSLPLPSFSLHPLSLHPLSSTPPFFLPLFASSGLHAHYLSAVEHVSPDMYISLELEFQAITEWAVKHLRGCVWESELALAQLSNSRTQDGRVPKMDIIK